MDFDGFDPAGLIVFCVAFAIVIGGLLSSRRRH